MTKKEREILAEGLGRLAADLAGIVEALGGPPAKNAPEATVAGDGAGAAGGEGAGCTYEEARAVLAELARTGYRAEVKALLTSHGLERLSDERDPARLAAIVADAGRIGHA